MPDDGVGGGGRGGRRREGRMQEPERIEKNSATLHNVLQLRHEPLRKEQKPQGVCK